MSGEDLPEGWQNRPLAELVDRLQYGLTAKASEGARGPRFLRITDLSDRGVDWQTVPGCEIGSDDARKFALEDGDIVFARSGSIEKAWRVENVPERAVFASYLIRGRPPDRGTSDWLAHFVKSPQYLRQIRDAAAGLGMSNVSASKLAEFAVPVGPLDQRRRIVAKLDALRARSRRAKDALDAVPALLDRLRQSILAAAFRGDLTADWREQNPDVEPASELLKRIRIERRTRWEESELAKMIAKGKPPKDDRWKSKYVEPEPLDESDLPELPDRWCWSSLSELAWSGPSNGVSPASSPDARGPRTLRLSATTQGRCVLDEHTTKRIDDTEGGFDDVWLEPGDLLVQRANTLDLVGTSAVFDGPPATFLYPDLMMRLRLVSGPLTEWTWRALSAPFTRRYFRDRATGTAGNMPKINGGVVRATPVPLPPDAEITHANATVRRALSAMGTFDDRHLGVAAALVGLDAAILAAAFRGELLDRQSAPRASV